MDPKRLDFIEAHFKNPPSAACNRELAQELVDRIRALDAALFAAQSALLANAIKDVPPPPGRLVHASPADPLDVAEPKKKAKR